VKDLNIRNKPVQKTKSATAQVSGNSAFINTSIKIAYPQVLSKLITKLNDISLAEDALHLAVEKALVSWQKNMPRSAAAWLITVAYRCAIDTIRHQQKTTNISNDSSLESSYDLEESLIYTEDFNESALRLSFPDDLLRLIFTSCHPALEQKTQMALTLKHVLNFSNLDVANALVTSESNVQQRLVRAKKKIASSGIVYEVPKPAYWKERIHAVLNTIYLLFNEGYFTTRENTLINRSLCREAIYLARLLHKCCPKEPEATGLLALLLQLNARADARTDENLELLTLQEQNRSLWDQNAIVEGNHLTEKALKLGKGTPFAIQAAIASLHNQAKSFEETDWLQIVFLYQKLRSQTTNPVVELNYWVAFSELPPHIFPNALEHAINQIHQLSNVLTDYRHYHTVLAGLYFKLSNFKTALKHFNLAYRIAISSQQKNFIKKRIAICKLNR